MINRFKKLLYRPVLVKNTIPSEVSEEFEAKLKLIRISKLLPEIYQLIPYLKGNVETIHCSPCVENYKCIPKDVANLKTGIFGIFTLPNEDQ